jgi:hypothetical protein
LTQKLFTFIQFFTFKIKMSHQQASKTTETLSSATSNAGNAIKGAAISAKESIASGVDYVANTTVKEMKDDAGSKLHETVDKVKKLGEQSKKNAQTMQTPHVAGGKGNESFSTKLRNFISQNRLLMTVLVIALAAYFWKSYGQRTATMDDLSRRWQNSETKQKLDQNLPNMPNVPNYIPNSMQDVKDRVEEAKDTVKQKVGF